MPTTIQLATELTTDPAGLGYAALVASGSDGGLADALNLVRSGAGYLVYRKTVGIRELVANIVPADLTAMTAVQIAQLNLLFLGTATLDASDINVRTVVQTIFTGKATTLANFATLARPQGSRAEVLWGEGTRIDANAVAVALGRG